MKTIKRYGFLMVFIVPLTMPAATWLANWSGWINLSTWFPLFFLFIFLPVMDYLLGHDPDNVPQSLEREYANDLWFKAITIATLPVQLLVVAWAGHWFVNTPMSLLGMTGWLLSIGVVGGVLAITTAHELIHKDSKLEQAVGGVLLASVGYHGFKVEHLRGHHVHVSTPEDASSARFGVSSWRFIPEALIRNTYNAWKLEAQRLRGLGKSPISFSNELIGWTALWLAFAVGFWLWLGPTGLMFFFLQGLFAAGSLEVINYIEHYGLERQKLDNGRYERTTHLHSWNSDYWLSNLILFHLQRHSDHHAFPKRRYAILRHHQDSPQLPGGYASMFVLALIPPLWFRVINPRVERFKFQQAKARASSQTAA